MENQTWRSLSGGMKIEITTYARSKLHERLSVNLELQSLDVGEWHTLPAVCRREFKQCYQLPANLRSLRSMSNGGYT